VVLIDFWTYSCINCIHTLPYVTSWYSKYKDQGLVVIGVHTPEFSFEHDTSNVEQAMKGFGITYPVAQDNDYATWKAFNNLYWPAEYLIDAHGNIRYTHFGEGNYAVTEKAIQALLAEAGHADVQKVSVTQGAQTSFQDSETQEMYVGLSRRSNFDYPAAPSQIDLMVTYAFPEELPLHHWGLAGEWIFQPEFAQSVLPGDKLELHFNAKDVYLVMTSDQLVRVKVTLASPNQANLSEDVDGQGLMTVKESRLYHLVKLNAFSEGTVLLQFEQDGVQIYSFTFGG